jgi:Rrf2 family cysteine metabolism transcriptional repressor
VGDSSIATERTHVRLSTRARYALRMMVSLARERKAAPGAHARDNASAPTGDATSLGNVAQRTGISRRYLDHVVIPLKQHGLLRGHSGRNGGYELGLPPEDITALAIIEAAVGPINVVECVRRPEVCLKADLCECRILYVLLNRSIMNVLGEITLSQLTDKQWYREVSRRLQDSLPGSGSGGHGRITRGSHATREEGQGRHDKVGSGRPHARPCGRRRLLRESRSGPGLGPW